MANENPWKGNGNDGTKRQNSTGGLMSTAFIEEKNEKHKNIEEAEKDEACPREATTWTEMAKQWPKSTIFIVLNEFCERFSFYGMRTVLTLYFLNALKFSANSATMMFNGSTVLFYSMPIFGSILADGYLGKFRTIFFLSLLYAVGQCVLCFASTLNGTSSLHPFLDILGLVIIGVGTGGIKPCVCSFGGDQFEPHQQKMLSVFFSAFYFAINAGAMISTFISPMFRAMPCLGQDSCYPLAFGVPAALMVLATILFMSASFWYIKRPPKENIFREVYQVGKNAIVNKWRSKGSKKRGSHWLDFYFDSHLCDSDQKCEELRTLKDNPNECHKRRLVSDVRRLLRVLVVYLPAPVFWALYDQQGSRWLIQSVMMDCRLWGNTLLLPDQMLTLNSVLILLFIPMFQVIVYPMVSLLAKITPLRKMVAGGLLAALAFVLSAIVQFQINTTLPDIPMDGRAFVSAINAFDNCILKVCAENEKGPENCRTLEPNQTLTNTDRKRPEMFELYGGQRKWHFEGEGGDCEGKQFGGEVGQELSAGRTYWMMASRMGVLFGETETEKPTGGKGEFKVGITLALEDVEYGGNLALCRWNPRESNESAVICDPRRAADFVGWEVDKVIGHETKGKKQLTMSLTDTGIELEVGTQGGVYMLAVTGNLSAGGDRPNSPRTEKRVFHAVPDNSLSILWQIPQIMVLTAAEVLFSITGYEFAYSQAPPSMKSLVQALWLMTTAIGDTIILLITLIAFPNAAVEFLFYAVVMVVVSAILALLAIFYYEYSNYTTTDSEMTTKLEETEGKREPLKGGGKGRRIQIYGTTDKTPEEEEKRD
ncbi:hypothetical protein niasHT_007885 [Heterodera trifolii]|uniref:Oligopeptide transporter 1 n=1 Tax=Heterodera trifolii TaxID=157864 RepID=A0ABD2LZB1_9BILA